MTYNRLGKSRSEDGFESGSALVQEGQDLDFLYDVELQLRVELGVAELCVRDLLSWKKGSVIFLNQQAGDPCALFANGKFLGKGELVTVNENYGLRVTEIASSDI